MPFRPELHYMYLFMKQYIEGAFPEVSCQRGDDTALTVPLLDKIVIYIREADVVIADCTGRNPNVFYELGIAHTLQRDVILITCDPASEVPTDVRAFEFISYTNHKDFCEKLQSALNAVLRNPFAGIYDKIAPLFDEFRQAKNWPITKVSKKQFALLADAQTRSGKPLPSGNDKELAKMFLPVMVDGPIDLDVMQAIKDWIEEKFSVESVM